MESVGKADNKIYKGGIRHSRVVLSFVIGFVLGSVTTWIALGSTAFSPTILIDSPELLGDATMTASTSLEYVIVEDQLAGDRVLIKEIALTDSGWAVVHEDAGGVPGNALGAQRFDKGVHSGTIYLLRNTEADQGYYILLYRDNGDRKFDLETDILITDAEASPIKSTFQVIRIDRKIN